MGAACCVASKVEKRTNELACVAAKDRTATNGLPTQHLLRHVRRSPSWNFRWDNRGRVAGEEESAVCLRETGGTNDQQEVKCDSPGETAFASEEGSTIHSFQSLAGQDPPVSKESTDQYVSQKPVEVKGSTECRSVSQPLKLSPSAPAVSSPQAMLLPSQSHSHNPNSNLSRCHHRSPEHHLSQQVTDMPIPEYKSPTFSIPEEKPSFQPPDLANESSRGSSGGSSDSGSVPAFSELMKARRERWSFDSETSSLSLEKVTKSGGRDSNFPSFDLQTCGVCARLLTERSACGWNDQKIMSTNELAVVSVLTCGHVYHAECLDCMTPETHKYDPSCPVCTLGEKQALKIFENGLKAALDLKAQKLSRKRHIDDSPNHDVFAHHKNSGTKGKFLKTTSRNVKSSPGKSLNRHASFGLKGGMSSENHSPKTKGFFWSRSSKK